MAVKKALVISSGIKEELKETDTLFGVVNTSDIVTNAFQTKTEFKELVEAGSSTLASAITSGLSSTQVDGVVGYSQPNGVACIASLNYADAKAAVEAIGGRLPTLKEVKSGAVTGSGCSYDDVFIWTSTEGETEGTHYVTGGRGDVGDVTGTEERLDTLTAVSRIVYDTEVLEPVSCLNEKTDEGKSISKAIADKTIDVGGVANVSGGLITASEAAAAASRGQATGGAHFIQGIALGNTSPCYVSCIKSGLLFINDVYIQKMHTQDVYSYQASTGDKIEVKRGACTPIYRRNNNQPYEANNPSQVNKEFFWNRFRGANTGIESVTAFLPIDTNIKIYGPNPTFVNGVITGTPQHEDVIPGGKTRQYNTVGTGEYYMVTDYLVLHSSQNNDTQDPRTIPPPAFKLLGIIRSSGGNNCSSLRDNNTVKVHTQRGDVGTFTASPGQPAKLDVDSAYDTGNAPIDTQLFYEAMSVIEGTGEMSVYAGADGAGSNAVQAISTEAMGNEIVLPIDIKSVGTNTRYRSVIGSLDECECYVYLPDGSYLGRLDLRRGNGGSSASPATTVVHQKFPAAVNFQPEVGIFAGITPIARGTKFVLNMKGAMYCNLGQSLDAMASEDETSIFSFTNPETLCEVRQNQITGLRERNRLNDAGTDYEWVPC